MCSQAPHPPTPPFTRRYRGRLVAVQSCRTPAGTAITPQDKRAVLAELTALGSLKHLNIVTLYGVCYHADGAVSIVEELADCDAQDLLAALEGGRAPLEQVYKLGLDIVRGVDFMHRNGKTHCDLKTANVLICKGSAVLCDFGLAHTFTMEKQGSVLGGHVGTLPYTALENFDPVSFVFFATQPVATRTSPRAQ